ncbi:MAG: SRPBCC family protein [Planctomycetes bacterium]|nr:SRPBCC family protein [Planctomycetota bacterium]
MSIPLMILAAVVVLVVVLVVVVALRPSGFSVARSMGMAAPAGRVFEQVNDLHKWEAWSPWAKLDPDAKVTYDGPAAGVGAGFAWVGSSKVGEGRMTITESRPGELVRFRLEFLKPMKATNTAEFTFRSAGGQTVVTWTMSGRNNFAGKAFGLVVNCDKMVGGQFEKGLADMKSIVERAG